MKRKRFVFDTNTFVSATLLKGSVNDQAIDKGFEVGDVVISSATFAEFTEVIFRRKFDKYLTDEKRLQIIQKLEQDTHLFDTTITINDCRDPKDNKFLELAVEAEAACIITGDQDLLILHPFRSIPILSPAEFLKWVTSNIPQ